MPSTTASLPSLITLRASNGSVTMRNQPSGAAALRVDVTLQLPDALGLQAHAVHLVAAVALVGIDLAELAVVDEQVGEHPQPAGQARSSHL
jgi:uncharacterized protein (UPF0212 family)